MKITSLLFLLLACGGVKDYFPYSKKIDITAFLQKVKKYTEAEDAYNKKWGIFSTCDTAPQPKDVLCKNGTPTLKH